MADNRTGKIYCGDQTNLPGSYNRFGTRYECLQCGFGAAMNKYKWEPASREPRGPRREQQGCFREMNNPRGNVKGNQFRGSSPSQPHQVPGSYTKLYGRERKVGLACTILLWLLLCTALFLGLYLGKPGLIMVTDNNKERKISWGRFSAVYIPSVIVLALLCFHVTK